MGYGPTYSTYDIAATGTTGFSAAKEASQNSTTVTVSGTYTSVAFTLQGTCGGGDWFNIACIDMSSGATVTGGTTISPSDNAEAAWTIPNAVNLTAIRTNVSSYSTGTATIRAFSTTGNVQPNITVTQTTGAFTNITASGTAAITGVTSLGAEIKPTTDDGAPLGDTSHNFSDLFLATGAVVNYQNSNVVITHTSGILTMGTGELRITTVGTNTASVVTVGGTQTLTAKTFVAPVLGVATGTSLAVSGLLTTSSPTAAFGYATGAGGAVTQSTDKTTGVTSNTNTTAITTNNASLAAATVVAFTFTNSAIAATDTVVVTHQSAGTSGAYTLNAFPGSGSAVISIRNNTAGALAEAIVLRVTIIKSVSA